MKKAVQNLLYPAFLVQKYGVSGNEGYAFVLVAKACIGKDWCEIKNRELEKLLLVSNRTAIRYVKYLEVKGLLRCEYKSVDNGAGRSGIYERKIFVNRENPDVDEYMKVLEKR